MGKKIQKLRTQYPGVRYWDSKTKKHNGKPDRYFYIRYKRSGKLVEESVGCSSRGMNAGKANRLRAEITQNIKEGKPPQSLNEKRELEKARQEGIERQKRKDAKANFTFDQLADQYLTWARENKASWKDDVSRYNKHLKPVLADKPLKDISPFDIEKLKSTLQKKKVVYADAEKHLSPATVKHCLVLVRQMFNRAINHGLYSDLNPIKKIKLPKVDNKRLRFLSHEEATLLLADLKKRSQTTYDLALLSIRTGARFDEMTKLRWQDIDLTNGLIYLEGKSGETRPAYLTPDLKDMFQNRQKGNPGELIFQKKKIGGKIDRVSHAYWRSVKALGLNDGITDPAQKVVFHTLRHTFASWLAIQGIPIYTIKELMGHKTLAMTERYAHLMPDHKREAINEMMAAINNRTDSNFTIRK